MRPTLLTLAAVGLLVVCAIPPLGSAQEDSSPPSAESIYASLSGDWVLATSDAEARRDAAVERAIDDMGLVVRAIARGRLRDGMPIPPDATIGGTTESAAVRLGLYDARFGLSDSPSSYREPLGGDNMRGTHRLRRGALIQRFASDDASLTHAFWRQGEHLSVRIRIASDRLPADAVYRLRFRRR